MNARSAEAVEPRRTDLSTEPTDEAVQRATRFQPWRKLLHAFVGVSIAAALSFLRLEQAVFVAISGGALVTLLVVDVVRLSNGDVNRLFLRAFSALASSQEAARPASSTWYALGVLLVVALFPRPNAVSAVLVLGVADPLASYFGRRWGKTPFLGGTVLGTVTFFVVAVGILGVRHGLATGAVAALAATLVERRSGPLDDNLTIPVVCAGVLAGLARLL